MRFIVMFFILAALTLCAAGCREDSAAPKAADAKPSLFVSVLDLPCDEMQQMVRDKMRQDPGLGLAAEKQVQNGLAFATPSHTEKQTRWSAVVLAQCMGPKNTRLSVLVKAEKKEQGKWMPLADTSKLEKAILDKVKPAPPQ